MSFSTLWWTNYATQTLKKKLVVQTLLICKCSDDVHVHYHVNYSQAV